MKAAIAVTISSKAWAKLRGAKSVCERAATAALDAPAPKGGAKVKGPVEISIVLASNKIVRDLNLQFRGIDKPTNVLSFPALGDEPRPTGAPATLGDVVIAFETTKAEAKRDGKSLKDHLTHLVIHGVLHLRGYDHDRPKDATKMEALETKLLATLGVDDPYGDSEWELAS
ncbi:MAG TPA: rRNA maturation RNase YbeY [Magnetospirillaceae bacterium]|jgi:probable rRNA maturation factor